MYANAEYYTNEYGGEIPADTVAKFLRLASERIDTATYNRIVARGFDNLTQFQQEKIKLATCLVADYMAEYGTDAGSVESYSVLDISVTVGTAGTEAARLGVPELALEALQKTGLCWRGL